MVNNAKEKTCSDVTANLFLKFCNFAPIQTIQYCYKTE